MPMGQAPIPAPPSMEAKKTISVVDAQSGDRLRPTSRGPVHENVPVPHQLPRRLTGRSEAETVHDIVEPGLELDQQVFARDPLDACSTLKHGAELPLADSIDSLHLLLLTELSRILRLPAPAPSGTVLARRIRLALDRAFLREAALPLEEELVAFPAAKPADGSRVSCHERPFALATVCFDGRPSAEPSDASLLGRTTAVVRNRSHVPDRPDREAGALQRLDRGLPARAGALDAHMNALHAH